MKHFLAAAIIATLGVTSAQENYAQWAHYKTLTINTTASGANVANNVAKFPMLVRLRPASGGDIVHFSIGRGADIRFTKADGVTRLPHQIERWDSAQQIADIWVLLDTVYGNNNSQSFRVYWGRAGVADSSNGSRVFDTANGYASVWHLGEPIGLAPRPNAIAGRFPATPRNFAPGYHRKPGIAGWSDSLTGGENFSPTSYLAMAEGVENNWFNFPNGQFSYTVWAYPVDANNFIRLISLTSTDPGDDRIFLSFNNGNIIGRVWGENNASNAINSTTPPPLNTWSHYAMTTTRGPTVDTTRLYLNGAQIQQSTHSPMTNAARGYVRIGRDEINNNDFTFNGRVDEARISHVTRSADYIRLSFETQKPDAAVLAQGAATPATGAVPAPAAPVASPSNLSYATQTATYTRDSAITANAATVTGTVDTFTVVPALPAGLSLNPATGAITGTPTAVSQASNYTVVAHNASGTATAVLSIAVTAPVSSIRPSGFAIRVDGAAHPYTFAIAPEAAASTDAMTLTILDPWGRTVWQKTVHPSRDGVREVTWNGMSSAGRHAAAGMYFVRATTVSEGNDAKMLERMISLKPR